MSSSFLHVVAFNLSEFHFFLRRNSIPMYVHTTFRLSIHLSMGICVVSTFLAVVNSAAVNTDIKICVQVLTFNSFGFMSRSEIAG